MARGFGLVGVRFRGLGVFCLVVHSLLVVVGFGCVTWVSGLVISVYAFWVGFGVWLVLLVWD